MIDADDFLRPLAERGFSFFTGVPCSLLTPLINKLVAADDAGAHLAYIPAASEGEAVAIAAGAWLAGRESVVMCQNSGLGNAVNPLTSLNHPFRIPCLLLTTWRGAPSLGDEPQHELMGAITPALLDLLRIAHRPFPTRADTVAATLDEAVAHMAEHSRPFAFILEKGDMREAELDAVPVAARSAGLVHELAAGGALPTRFTAMEAIVQALPGNAGIIATTGKCGRELFTIADREQHLYQVGSMGGAAGMGLGAALNVSSPIIVLDGDGAALMKLGSMATIGALSPANLVHVILDNASYDSTGGQPTTSPVVRFAHVARACGYRSGWEVDDLAGLRHAITQALAIAGPHLVHMRIARGSSSKLARPDVAPCEVARRFKSFLAPWRIAGR